MTNKEKRERIAELLKQGKKPGEIVKELETSHATVKKVKEDLDEDNTEISIGRIIKDKQESSSGVAKIPMEELRQLIKKDKELQKEIIRLKEKYNVNNSYIRGVLQKSV